MAQIYETVTGPELRGYRERLMRGGQPAFDELRVELSIVTLLFYDAIVHPKDSRNIRSCHLHKLLGPYETSVRNSGRMRDIEERFFLVGQAIEDKIYGEIRVAVMDGV